MWSGLVRSWAVLTSRLAAPWASRLISFSRLIIFKRIKARLAYISAWSGLPEPIRRAILALADSGRQDGGERLQLWPARPSAGGVSTGSSSARNRGKLA